VTLADLLNNALHDDGIRVVLWHGAGDSFCSGNDIEDFLKNPPGPGQSTTRMPSSCKALFSKSANVTYMLDVIAFFFAGRLNMTRKMFPECSVMISLICRLLPA